MIDEFDHGGNIRGNPGSPDANAVHSLQSHDPDIPVSGCQSTVPHTDFAKATAER